jgi:hypothetical protein
VDLALELAAGSQATSLQASGNGEAAAPITVGNQNGNYFFTKGGMDEYGDKFGTARFQGATLLHELAHETGAAFPDGDHDPMMGKNGGIDLERLNNYMVHKRCKKTLWGLSNK